MNTSGMRKTGPMRCEVHHEITMNHSAMNNPWLGMASMLMLCCVLLLAAQRCEAQGNLVPNPSFELQDTCPSAPGFVGGAKPLFWEKWNQSPEYFDACVVSDTLIDVPQNGMGYQHALDGDAYVGHYTYGSGEYREYLGCQLLQPLVVGGTYSLAFYANVAMGGNYWAPIWASNNVGMLFTMEPNIWTDQDEPPFAIRNYAHLFSANIISDTANWTLVSGTFVADSAYQYLVIGNFFSNLLTDTVHLFPAPSLGAYYFVDGVCVTMQGDVGCSFDNSVGQQYDPGLRIHPNPTSDWLHITLGETHVTPYTIYDLVGRVVIEGWVAGGNLKVDVGQWASGEYLLSVGEVRKQSVRLVVMH